MKNVVLEKEAEARTWWLGYVPVSVIPTGLCLEVTAVTAVRKSAK